MEAQKSTEDYHDDTETRPGNFHNNVQDTVNARVEEVIAALNVVTTYGPYNQMDKLKLVRQAKITITEMEHLLELVQ